MLPFWLTGTRHRLQRLWCCFTELVRCYRRIRDWLAIEYGPLSPAKMEEHKQMIAMLVVFYGFTFVFIFIEAIKNTLMLNFAGRHLFASNLTIYGVVYLSGVAFFIAVHAVVLARLQIKLVRSNLHYTSSDMVRFAFRNMGKFLGIVACHFYVLFLPIIYIELNRATPSAPHQQHLSLTAINMSISYWNYGALDLFLGLAVVGAVIYIKKI